MTLISVHRSGVSCGAGQMSSASKEWESIPGEGDQRGKVGLEGLGKEHGLHLQGTDGSHQELFCRKVTC